MLKSGKAPWNRDLFIVVVEGFIVRAFYLKVPSWDCTRPTWYDFL